MNLGSSRVTTFTTTRLYANGGTAGFESGSTRNQSRIETFQMERMQSTWENLVRYNLSESGVHPLSIAELVGEGSDRDAFLGTELGYGQSNGTPELRRSIASLYSQAGEENVLVTTGTAEANFLVSWVLTEPGD